MKNVFCCLLIHKARILRIRKGASERYELCGIWQVASSKYMLVDDKELGSQNKPLLNHICIQLVGDAAIP